MQGSVKINQNKKPTLDPRVGFNIDSIDANATLTIEFDSIVTSLQPNPYIYNLSNIGFDYTPIRDVNPILTQIKSP